MKPSRRQRGTTGRDCRVTLRAPRNDGSHLIRRTFEPGLDDFRIGDDIPSCSHSRPDIRIWPEHVCRVVFALQ